MKDLIVLVADKNMDFLVRGLLPRIPKVENLRLFSYDILIHPHRDPGIFNEADIFLKSLSANYSYAMAMLDHHGSGREQMTREEIEQVIAEKLNKAGWEDRSTVICIYPELENWIWVNEAKVQDAISWEHKTRLYDWLHKNQLKSSDSNKPSNPKEAFDAATRLSKTPRSSSLYFSIASQASYRKCEDAAFQKMLSHLKAWFALNSLS